MKTTVTVLILLFCVASIAVAETADPYRSQLREMFETRDEWFETFSEEAAAILLRERVSVRTMEIIQAEIGRELLPENPSDAAETFCAVAREADALLRRGETPARVALQTRVNMQRRNETGADITRGSSQVASPRSDMRNDRAKGAISAAKEKRTGSDSSGQGPK